jgi:hypothetical protein
VTAIICPLVSAEATPETGGRLYRLALVQFDSCVDDTPPYVRLEVLLPDGSWQIALRLGRDLRRFGVDLRSPSVIVLDEKLAASQLENQLERRGVAVVGRQPSSHPGQTSPIRMVRENQRIPLVEPYTYPDARPAGAAGAGVVGTAKAGPIPTITGEIENAPPSAPKREPVTRGYAIELARACALRQAFQGGAPAYLPGNAAEAAVWEPHEWVVQAIMEASK